MIAWPYWMGTIREFDWVWRMNGSCAITYSDEYYSSLIIFEWDVDWSPLIQNLLFVLYEYCYLLLNGYTSVLHLAWKLIGIDCWCLHIKNVNKFNLLVEAMNGLMLTIIDNTDIHYHIILLVILDINCLRLTL